MRRKGWVRDLRLFHHSFAFTLSSGIGTAMHPSTVLTLSAKISTLLPPSINFTLAPPPLQEGCKHLISDFRSFAPQYGTNAQYVEPVAWSIMPRICQYQITVTVLSLSNCRNKGLETRIWVQDVRRRKVKWVLTFTSISKDPLRKIHLLIHIPRTSKNLTSRSLRTRIQ